MYIDAYLQPTGTSMVEILGKKTQESFIVDVLLGSKYTSNIGFTVEKVYRLSTFIWYVQSRLQKFIIAFLFLKLIKNMLV